MVPERVAVLEFNRELIYYPVLITVTAISTYFLINIDTNIIVDRVSVILENIMSQSLWAAVAMFLFIYFMKSTEKRDLRNDETEEKYNKIISELSEKFNIVSDIKKDIE